VPAKKEYLNFILDWLAPLGDITSRSMMGGYVLYCNRIVFALVAANVLYLKSDDLTRPRFEQLGLEPFQPFPDRPELTRGKVMQYYQPPPEFFEDAGVMSDWGRAAVEAGRRAAAKRARKPRRTTHLRKA
jgi:DNA transformation protein